MFDWYAEILSRRPFVQAGPLMVKENGPLQRQAGTILVIGIRDHRCVLVLGVGMQYCVALHHQYHSSCLLLPHCVAPSPLSSLLLLLRMSYKTIAVFDWNFWNWSYLPSLCIAAPCWQCSNRRQAGVFVLFLSVMLNSTHIIALFYWGYQHHVHLATPVTSALVCCHYALVFIWMTACIQFASFNFWSASCI